MEASGETFKIQSGPLTCILEKVYSKVCSIVYLWKCKVCGEATYFGKAKTKFQYRSNNYKSKQIFQERKLKNAQKRFHHDYCLDGHLGIHDWDFVLFEQCETHTELKERQNL